MSKAQGIENTRFRPIAELQAEENLSNRAEIEGAKKYSPPFEMTVCVCVSVLVAFRGSVPMNVRAAPELWPIIGSKPGWMLGPPGVAVLPKINLGCSLRRCYVNGFYLGRTQRC